MTPSAVPEKINKSLNPLRSDKSTHCHFVQFPKQMRSYASSHFRFINFIFSENNVIPSVLHKVHKTWRDLQFF